MERLSLLSKVFPSLVQQELEPLARAFVEERYPTGAVLVKEGEAGDRFYVVAEGRAEVTAKKVPLASLGPGDVFGEIALLVPDARRMATVTSLEDMVVLSLSSEEFGKLLQAGMRERFEESARSMLLFRFLRVASPFSGLDEHALSELASRIETSTVPADTAVLNQGEAGDTAYCIMSGKVQVVRDGQPVAELEAGALFGEAALLTDSPRNASVTAITDCELLSLKREVLLQVMKASPSVAESCISMLRMRERPRREEGVELFEGHEADGTSFAVLRDRRHGRYFRLSRDGRFIWDRLDGEHDLRALSIEFFIEFRRFSPYVVADIVNSLAAAGFVSLHRLSADLAGIPPIVRFFMGIRSVLDWQVALANCDGRISCLYESAIQYLYCRWASVAMLGLLLTGILAFLFRFDAAMAILGTPHAIPFAGWVLAACILSIIAHEAGHAFTTKACGREVQRIGIGWHWVSPVCFVDTTDMWLASKKQRVAVDFAGLYVNLVLAGIASDLALFFNGGTMAALWLFSAISYVVVLLNLNPLLEYDGYHMLSDWLDRPNLRREAFRWLKRPVADGHRVNLLYNLLAFSYMGGVIAFVLVPIQGWLQSRFASTLGLDKAFFVSWGLFTVVLVSVLASIVVEMVSLPKPGPAR